MIYYVCKFCDLKVSRSYLARHALDKHFEKIYREVEFGEQSLLEEAHLP
jgi:hypothetical protein